MKVLQKYMLVFLACYSYTLHAQEMLVDGKQWVFEVLHYNNIVFPYSDTTIETITVVGDTSILNQTYKKLVFSYIPFCMTVIKEEFLREEGDKVYRLSHDHQQEFLMIDFAETSGYEMTYDHLFGGVDTGMVRIDSFGSQLVYDGTILQVQHMRIQNNQSFDDDQPYHVFRNIGFLSPGILFPNVGSGLCDFADYIQIRCVISGNDTIHFTEFDCFELPVSNSTENLHYKTISLYPNPASDFLYIPDDLIVQEIFSLDGKPFTLTLNDSAIRTSHLPPGQYVVRLISSSGNQIYMGKFVKF